MVINCKSLETCGTSLELLSTQRQERYENRSLMIHIFLGELYPLINFPYRIPTQVFLW
jgi:hypothetical protein